MSQRKSHSRKRARLSHAGRPPRPRSLALLDLILGAQDGIVNALGVSLGVAAAGGGSRVVLAAGLATAFGGSTSMAAVAYTSTRAEGDVYRSERAREYRHVRAAPTLERAEVREIYQLKGFRGDLLDRIVDTITADPDVWVAVMMNEEHGLAPDNPTPRPPVGPRRRFLGACRRNGPRRALRPRPGRPGGMGFDRGRSSRALRHWRVQGETDDRSRAAIGAGDGGDRTGECGRRVGDWSALRSGGPRTLSAGAIDSPSRSHFA